MLLHFLINAFMLTVPYSGRIQLVLSVALAVANSGTRLTLLLVYFVSFLFLLLLLLSFVWRKPPFSKN